MRELRRTTAGYFGAQAALGAAWWLALFVEPSWRASFVPADAPPWVLVGFLPGDALWFVGGSAFVAIGAWRGAAWTAHAAVAVAAATTYAAQWCATVTLRTGEAWLATAAMVPAALFSLVLAVAWLRAPAAAAPTPPARR